MNLSAKNIYRLSTSLISLIFAAICFFAYLGRAVPFEFATIKAERLEIENAEYVVLAASAGDAYRILNGATTVNDSGHLKVSFTVRNRFWPAPSYGHNKTIYPTDRSVVFTVRLEDTIESISVLQGQKHKLLWTKSEGIVSSFKS